MLKRAPILIFLIAFGIRLFARLSKDHNDFWINGYRQYLTIADHIVHEGQFYLNTAFGLKRSFFPPVYPLFLAALTQGERWYWPVVLIQSTIGAATALLVYLIGRELFNSRAAAIAGFVTAIYPYYVFHDVRIQETGLFTCLTALAIYLLLRSQKHESKLLWLATGLALGIATLTRASLQPFVLMLLVWLGFSCRRGMLLTALGFCLTVSPWLIRNYVVVGSPTLSSQTGRFVWTAHNQYTFSYYPYESIDKSEIEARRHFTAHEKREMAALDEIAQANYFRAKGIAYMKEHPGQTLYQSWVKVQTGFSWVLTPMDGRLKQLVYFVSYFPILILGIWGALRSRERWKELVPIYLLFVSFTVGTAIFWAHTSHRSYLDIYLILFAAYTIAGAKDGRRKSAIL